MMGRRVEVLRTMEEWCGSMGCVSVCECVEAGLEAVSFFFLAPAAEAEALCVALPVMAARCCWCWSVAPAAAPALALEEKSSKIEMSSRSLLLAGGAFLMTTFCCCCCGCSFCCGD